MWETPEWSRNRWGVAARAAALERTLAVPVLPNMFGAAMLAIHKATTLNSKGQITLPMPIRKALGVDLGGWVVIELIGDCVVITRG